MKIRKLIAFSAALVMCAAVLTACGKNGGAQSTETSGESVTTSGTDTGLEIVNHPLEEGDVAAIRKFSVSDPGKYELVNETENGRLYIGENSQIEVMALNYKEDLNKTIAEFADTACASMKVTNMLYKADTEFSGATEAKIAGFDAVMYDYTVYQNAWLDADGNVDLKNGTKTVVGTYKSRVYYFYSDKDAFYAIFTTDPETWDECLPKFESFMSSLTIDENAQPAETEATESDEDIVATGEEITEEIIEDDGGTVQTEINADGEEVIS